MIMQAKHCRARGSRDAKTLGVPVSIPSSSQVSARTNAVWSALGSAFGLDLLTGMIVFAFSNSYLVQVLHAPPSYPAFALGVWGVVKLLASPVSGWVTDHMRGSFAASLAIALNAVGILVMLLIETGPGYIAGMAPLAAGTTLAWLLVFRALGEHTDESGRAEASARMTIIASAGLAVGLAIAAYVSEQAERHAGFWVALGVTAAMALPLVRASVGLQAPEHVRRETTGGWRTLVSGRAEAVVGLVTLVHFIAFAGIVVVLGPFALEELGLRLSQTLILGLPAGVAAAIALWLAGQRSKHGQRLWEVGVLYLLGAVAMIVAAGLTHAWPFAAAMILLGISVGGSSPLLAALRIDVSLTDPRPGAVLGRLSFADGVGAALGPFFAGFAIEFAGIRMGMMAAGIAFALTGVLALAYARSVRL